MKKLLTIVIAILLLLGASILITGTFIHPGKVVEEQKKEKMEVKLKKIEIPEKKEEEKKEDKIEVKKTVKNSTPAQSSVKQPTQASEPVSPPPQQEEKAEDNSMTYIGTYHITGYDTCSGCCGKSDGITASGTHATPGRTIAMKGYPYGTKVYIEGLGYRTIEDTGGFSSNTIDVVCSNHSECYAITGNKKVYLV